MPAKTFLVMTEEIPKQFQSPSGSWTQHMGLDQTVQFSKLTIASNKDFRE